MSRNEKIYSCESCEDCECKAPVSKLSTIQSLNVSCDMSNALSAKVSTNEENQSLNSSCQDCECNDLSTNVSIDKGIQSLNLSCDICNPPAEKIPTNEEDQSLSSSYEDCDCNPHPKNMPDKEEDQRPTLCCKGTSAKILSDVESQLVSLSLSSIVLFAKTLCDDQSISLSFEVCNTGEALPIKMSSDEEIQSRSSSSEDLPTNLSPQNSSENLCCNLPLVDTESATSSLNSQITMGALSPLDPSSYSRPELAIIKHISLNLNVDFEEQVLSGQATIDFDVLKDINDLILDASNLTIQSIEAKDGSQLQYKMGEHLANMGSKLTILLPKQLSSGEQFTVKIKYSTAPTASALQWLDPEQTSGKKHPYLFSQCQPIHARSILPCQDTPAVKFTYDAEVSAPEEFTVLMSALRGEKKSSKTTFRQPMPLPSYLVAIAVGVLESRTLGPRSKVWSEKEEIERSAWEFAETEKYLQAAEKLCGPYEWTQYDLLVLPPSFPYGGMENPCLTFVTPTLLAGDRSQADVIVHEIMHSWTGNLVTNRNFEHFWLNEGFTVFLERKVGASLINDSVEAKKSRDFQSLLGLQELSEAINLVLGPTNPLTSLVVDLNGVHPDDAFSTVPYEKGSLFLRYLEDLFGGPAVFDDFLRSYLTKFRKKSLDTEEFKRFLLGYFKGNEELKKVDWDTWLYKSGMPPIIPAYDTSMTKAISAVIVKIDDPNVPLSYEDVKSFGPHQMIHLLQQLIDRPALPLERLKALGTEYKVSGNSNSEIMYRWLRLCVRSRDQTKINDVFNFVNNQGRMKYVRPLYRDLYAWEDVREQAINNFLNHEKNMMHVSAYTLRKDLHLDEKTTE